MAAPIGAPAPSFYEGREEEDGVPRAAKNRGDGAWPSGRPLFSVTTLANKNVFLLLHESNKGGVMAMPASAGSGPTDTAKQLYAAARQYAESRGYEFGDGVDSAMRQYASSAAIQIERRRLGEIGINDAGRAFETLVDGMIEAAQRIPGYAIQNPNVVGEQTLGLALGKLCPLWPFC